MVRLRQLGTAVLISHFISTSINVHVCSDVSHSQFGCLAFWTLKLPEYIHVGTVPLAQLEVAMEKKH